jgi:hypothetical protein
MRWFTLFTAPVATFFFLGSAACYAQQPVQAPPAAEANLLESVQAARENFRPVPEDHLAQRRNELQQAMAELDQMLARSNPGYAEGWKEYLHWDQLVANIADIEQPDIAALRDIYERFRRNNNGLEMARFLKVRDRLRDYLDALLIARQPKLQESYAAALDSLAKRLEEYEKSPTGLNGPEIGRTLGWLEAAGQADQLVSAVQQRYDHPNLYAQASERFLGAGFNTSVDRTTRITDVILGTSISGVARFVGTQVLDTVPSAYDGRMNVLLRGNISSNNVGVNGPATIYSTGLTSIYSTKQLVVNENGVFAFPAHTNSCTTTKFNNICANCGLVERIAWKRAYQQKGEAEAIASQHASARMNGVVNQEAIDPVARANAEFQEKFRAPLLRRGHMPQHMLVNSSNSGIGVEILQMARGQIAAPASPPALGGAADLAVRTHESFVANFSEAAIGGIELTDERLAQILQEQTGRVPEELQITEDKEPWSITFADAHPVAAAFDDNQVVIYVRATRFTRGRNEDGTVDQEVTDPVQISAKYTIEKTDTGVRLERQGEVEVDFIGLQRLSAAQIGVKTFLRRKFGSLFKPEIVGEGLELQGRWARAGKLVIQEIQSDNGWVAVGWQQTK